MSEYRDERNRVIRITETTPPAKKDREEREQQIVEELYAIFDKRK